MEGIKFSLAGIKTEQFASFDENFSLSEKEEKDLEVALGFRFDLKRKQFGVEAEFIFTSLKKVVIKLKISCHFYISENAWLNNDAENSIEFDKAFVQHLAVIAVGTARGVLHAKTEGTILNSIFIPTIDVTEIVHENVKFPK